MQVKSPREHWPPQAGTSNTASPPPPQTPTMYCQHTIVFQLTIISSKKNSHSTNCANKTQAQTNARCSVGTLKEGWYVTRADTKQASLKRCNGLTLWWPTVSSQRGARCYSRTAFYSPRCAYMYKASRVVSKEIRLVCTFFSMG